MQTNEKVIQDFADAGNVKSLAMFHLLKKVQSHSVIYNYTAKKVAILTGLSENTASKYVKHLLNYKYRGEPIATLENGHLRLKSIAPKKHLCTIKFTENATIEHIEALLLGKLIERHKDQQMFNIHEKLENTRLLNNPKNYRENKRRVKLIRHIMRDSVTQTPYDVKMSVEHLSEILNVSQRKLRQVFKILVKLGIVKVKERIVEIRKATKQQFAVTKDYLIERYGYCYWSNGIIWNNQTRDYKFCDYKLLGVVKKDSVHF